MQTFDESKLQRLVDGQLDRESIQDVLRQADSNPELWREMAVGFVEDQIWQAEFQELSLDASQPTPAASNSQRQEQTKIQPWRLGRWLAIAAGILLGLTIGYLPSLTNWIAPVAEYRAAPDLEADQTPSIESTPATFHPDYHVSLKPPGDDPLLASDVPLFKQSDVEKMGYDMMQPIDINGELAQWLNQSGCQLDQNVNFISGRLNDGRQFIVPIRTTRIHYGQ